MLVTVAFIVEEMLFLVESPDLRATPGSLNSHWLVAWVTSRVPCWGSEWEEACTLKAQVLWLGIWEKVVRVFNANGAILKKKNPQVQWLRLCAPKAGSQGSIPGQGARCQMLQLRLCKTPHVTTRDPRSHNHKTYMPQLNTPHATTKIWHDQINTFKKNFF